MIRRLLAIGLDGFETTLAERLMSEGRLPNLAAAMAQSARANLDHGPAKRTGLAWEHFATGLTPAGAQRWSAVTFEAQRYRCWQEVTRLAPFPSRLPLETVVFDAPYFDLQQAERVRGLVSWGAHDPGTSRRARPDSLLDEVRARFGEYPAAAYIYGFAWASPERVRRMGAALVAATRQRTAISRWLLGERCPEWSLGVVVASELHSAVEALWHGVDPDHPLHHLSSAEPARRALEAVYEATDELIGELAAGFPDAAQLIFSMHGMGPNDSDVPSMALLPEFLYRRSFGRPLLGEGNGEATSLPMVAEQESWDAHVDARMLERPDRGHPLLFRLRRKARHITGGGSVRQRRAEADSGRLSIGWMPAAWYAPHWPRMPAFALPSFYDGQIRLNVCGREGNGLVTPEYYDMACRQIIADLTRCTDPRNGRSVVREAIRTHPGDPMGVTATEADVVVRWRGSPLAFAVPDGGVIGPLAYRRPGGHTGGHGISLWRGPHFPPGERPARSAFDVVPTIIDYLTGDALAAGVDGNSFLPSLAPGNVTLPLSRG
ncbi:MAG: hypothetical protein ACNA7W_06030 [Pseudomonadales bacterium]